MYGTMKIDCPNRNITLHVDPRGLQLSPMQKKQQRKKRKLSAVEDGGGGKTKLNLSNLSGGEKSKTMVCLIMALWQQQSPPFRFVPICSLLACKIKICHELFVDVWMSGLVYDQGIEFFTDYLPKFLRLRLRA